jgi:hypothetical protein
MTRRQTGGPRRAARVRSVSRHLAISPAIPAQLGASAEGFRAIQAYSDFGADIPAMKEIKAFAEKNEVQKKDVFYMKGWLKGHAIATAIENALKKNGGSVPTDIKAFRKTVRDGIEALKNLDDGGITPPLNYATTKARPRPGSQRSRMAPMCLWENGSRRPYGEAIPRHARGQPNLGLIRSFDHCPARGRIQG